VLAWQFPRLGNLALAGAGLLLGLALLTRAEVALGGLAGVGVALVLMLWLRRPALTELLCALTSLLAPALLVVAAAWLLLWLAMPARQALLGTLSSWMVAANPEVTGLPFFRAGMGTLDIADSLHKLLTASTWHVLFVTPVALWCAGPRWLASQRWFPPTIGVALATIASIGWRHIPWYELARPLPVLLLGIGAALAIDLFRRRSSPADGQLRIRQISLVCLSFAMLAKIILNCRIYQYGFTLAMPGTLVLVVALLGWAPRALKSRTADGIWLQSAVIPTLLVYVLVHLVTQSTFLATKRTEVGQGADRFFADSRGDVVQEVVDLIATQSPPQTTLAVLPEGIMLNYLARRENPTTYTNYMPTEVFHFGEQELIARFRAQPPDLILLAPKDTSEFGVGQFGVGYGKLLLRWINNHYGPIQSFPVQRPNKEFRLLLLRRIANPDPNGSRTSQAR
jgi:hypothetical protein